jgi:hypothetical protein
MAEGFAIDERLYACTIDTAANGVAAAKLLIQNGKLEEWLPCLPHVINLIVVHAMKSRVYEGHEEIFLDDEVDETSSDSSDSEIDEDELPALNGEAECENVQQLVTKVQRQAKYFKKVQTAGEQLFQAQQECIAEQRKQNPKNKDIMRMKPQMHTLAVVTRWNSILDMVSRAITLRDFAEGILFKKTKTRPLILSDDEWHTVKEVKELLSCFKVMTTIMSSSSTPTLSAVLPAFRTMIHRTKSTTVVHHISKRFQECLLSGSLYRWNKISREVYFISSCLDPRFSNLAFLKMEDRKKSKDLLRTLCNELTPVEPVPTAETKVDTKETSSIFEYGDVDDNNAGVLEMVENNNTGIVDREFQFHFSNKAEADSNPGDYWMNNARILPLMSQIWRVYGAIPASSVASERVFSISGHLIRRRRSALSSSTVDDIMLMNSIQHNLPSVWEKIRDRTTIEVLGGTPSSDNNGRKRERGDKRN